MEDILRKIDDLSLGELDKLYKYIEQPKSIPIHVRGALVYNNALEEYNLKRKYETIKEGEKIKFCYMKLPNPIKSNVISISSTLPSEFELEPYIDYNKQFDKAFLEPFRSVLGSIQWNEEKINTIEDFF